MALSNTELANKISALVDRWNIREDEMVDWINGTVGGGPNLDGKYPITDRDGVTVLVACPAQLEADVQGNVDSSLDYLNQTLAAKDAAVAAQSAAELAQAGAIDAEDLILTHKNDAAQSASDALDASIVATNAAADTLQNRDASAASATDAANSASEASASATSATQDAADAAASASAAATSEANAAASETNAANSAAGAATSESNAASSASAAALSETNAANSAAAAATSESNAAQSETNAANSAASAAASESNAQAHATSASASKDAAALSEVNAAQSEANAAASAQAAAQSAAEVEAAVSNAMVYRGLWDASVGSYPNPNDLTVGSLYKVSVAGTVDGKEYAQNDAIIYNGGDQTLSSGWDKMDNTDAVSSVAGKTGNVTLTKADVGLGSVRNVDSYSRAESDSQLAGKLDVNANAVSASKLLTARTIALGGDLLGSAPFDGSGGITITATVKDDSHNHVIANVDGLQAALDGKLDSGATAEKAKELQTISAGATGSGTAANWYKVLEYANTYQYADSNLRFLVIGRGNRDVTEEIIIRSEMGASQFAYVELDVYSYTGITDGVIWKLVADHASGTVSLYVRRTSTDWNNRYLLNLGTISTTEVTFPNTNMGTTEPTGDVERRIDATNVTKLWHTDNFDPASKADVGHNHDDRYYTKSTSDGRYLGISAKAADSGKLDGLNSTQFMRSDVDVSKSGYINGQGFGQSHGAVTTISHPYGAQAGAGNGTQGAIKITLPVSWTATMMHLTVKVYEYSTGRSFDMKLGGYIYTGEAWYNTFAYLIGDPDSAIDHTVRFGHDGSKCCIYIGETSSTWSYPKVAVTEVVLGHSSYDMNRWHSGWDVTFETTLATNIDATHTRTNVSKWHGGNEIWHSGNFDPSTKVNKSGDTINGPLTINHTNVQLNLKDSTYGGNYWQFDHQNGDLNFRYNGGDADFTLAENGTATFVHPIRANGAVQVPYAAGALKPMVVLQSATNYGLFHQEGTNDEFVFRFAGDNVFRFTQNGIGYINGNQMWHAGNFNPASKANSSHSHSISDVSGLQSALDGKAATSHSHNELKAVDDRDVKPNTTGIANDKAIKAFFTSLGGLNGGANTDYQDFLVLDTYSDSSGGTPNALAFDKSYDRIRHFRPGYNATTWGTGRELAYLDEVLPKSGGTVDGTVTANVSPNNWGFKGQTNGSNASGLWFSGDTGELILRRADGVIGARISATGSYKEINGRQIWTDEDVTFSQSEDGYVKLPNGLILQWTSTPYSSSYGGSADQAVYFPITFPNACLSVVSTIRWAYTGSHGAVWHPPKAWYTNRAIFDYTLSGRIVWAIGY